MSAVPGATDLRIRVLGLLAGLGVIAVLWRNARALGQSIPLIALTLLGFNSAVIVYGDSIRGYGLGMLTGLLAFGLVWQAADAPGPVRMGVALLSCLIAVHCLYYNAIFVLAACGGGLAVTLKRRAWQAAGLILGVGAVSAVSLTIYASVIGRTRAWNEILRADLDHALIWSKLEEAFASTGGAVQWVWIGLAVLAVGLAFRAGSTSYAQGLAERERDAALYCGVAISTGAAAYILFLKNLSYVTQPWYYVALMALVATCLDSPLSILARTSIARGVRLAAAIVMIALVSQPVWIATRTRRTNVDLIAAKIGALAVEGDQVVVSPWYVGITFERYYQGRADWVTVPPMPSHAMHRYDLLKVKMMTPGAITPVLDQIRGALRTGHRVFWVGDVYIPAEDVRPADPRPAPLMPWGWSDTPYYEAWALQAGDVLKNHAKAAERIEIPQQQPVNAYEDLSLSVFEGWWDGEGGH